MIYLNKIVITICVILIILAGIFFGFVMYNNEPTAEENTLENNVNIVQPEQNEENTVLETAVEEEKTTPNTLIVYKTYYTKCKHYIQKYEDIDVSLVNLTQKELEEKIKEWDIENFSPEEIELSKEEEQFCDEHYKLILENNVIVVYKVDENGIETEYEQTGITTEYLTNEDILKLTAGIYVYGKENLTNTIEDYE